MSDEAPKSEIILYNTEDGKTRLDVKMEGETVWLTQAQMAELFQTTKQNVSLHIQNFFTEGELQRAATVKESLTVQQEGKRSVQRRVEFYNLDVIISVGYRVKSLRGTQFRIWATQRLREYVVKGFAMEYRPAVPDVIGYLQRETELTRSTLAEILLESKRTADALKNPQEFMEIAASAIAHAKQELMVDGIKYERIAGQSYEMMLFQQEEIEGYLGRMVEVRQSRL